MASLSKSKMLFAFTSPRTLEKIIPEISLLVSNFEGKEWNRDNQIAFYKKLVESDFFEGTGAPQKITDGMQARDRINRAPRALGFVELSPKIKLTPAGNNLICGFRTHETITRQLLKFQLPSPNHTQSRTDHFCIRPYLELLRLIYDLGTMSKFEVAAFFMPMIDYHTYDSVKAEIIAFREECRRKRGQVNMKELRDEKLTQVIARVWRAEIADGNTETRESGDDSVEKFIKTKKANCKDYADAFFRYLRASGLVSLEKGSYHFVISKTKIDEVKYILENTPRDPFVFSCKEEFYAYLGASHNVSLLTDNKDIIIDKLNILHENVNKNADIQSLQEQLDNAYNRIKEENTKEEIAQLQDYSDYDDIIETFSKIKNKEVIDAPLMLEYNAWRAMTMLDHAVEVKGNFLTDSECMPICTAGGGKADIEIKYKDFGLIVEVTLSTGSKQYEMEGEPVARHFGNARQSICDNMYCIFIAARLNSDSIAYMFNTNRMNTRAYGGKTKIIPMSIDDFTSFIAATKEKHITDSSQISNFLEELWNEGQDSEIDELQWAEIIQSRVGTWV